MLKKQVKYLIIPTITMAFSMIGITEAAYASSVISVTNNTDNNVDVIYQAGGCMNAFNDPAGDAQFTVCEQSNARGYGDTTSYTFSLLESDRSAKIYVGSELKGIRVGECHSMDSHHVIVTGKKGKYSISGC